MVTRPGRLFVAVAGVLTACSWGDALSSDPSAWDPPRGAAPDASAPANAGASGSGGGLPSCEATPSEDGALTQSEAGRVSHRAGEPCLEGCHEAGGSARLVFAAAGTAYERQGERTLAAAGREVRGVGGSVLVIDACGNFYAVGSALRAAPSTTQPWVKDPTFRRMEKPLLRVARPGDCNQSGCHDFSGRLSSGIYF